MRTVKHYFFNILGIIASIIAYSYLQGCYFLPKEFLFFKQYNSIYLAAVTVLILALIFWLYRKQMDYRNDWGFNRLPHWRWRRIFIAVIAFLVIMVFQIFYIKFIGGNSANQQTLNQISRQGNDVLFNIMVVFVAPFCEETIFRGMFFNLFFTRKNKVNAFLGVIFSGLTFAYIHDPNFTKYIFLYWIMGSVLATVYLLTRDLRYSMLTHLLNNLMSVL